MSEIVSTINDSENISLRKIEKDSSLAVGQYGAKYINNTSEHQGSFGCIQALEDSTISALVSSNWTGTLTNIPLKTGVSIFGSFSSVTLSGGRVVAYNAAS
jgi:hypothetical protein